MRKTLLIIGVLAAVTMFGCCWLLQGRGGKHPTIHAGQLPRQRISQTANGAKVRKLVCSGKSQRKGSVAEACLASIEVPGTHMAGGRRQKPR